MDYECHIVPIDKLLVGPLGVQLPLCNSCKSPDCTNPIREKCISILGKNQQVRLWTTNNQVRAVIACKGYIGDSDVQMGSDQELDQTESRQNQ